MPLFALANAGVPIAAATFDAALTTAIVAPFVVGKPAGVVLFSILAVKLRLGIRQTSSRGACWRLEAC
jgi:NhaA family Na+:H+ antiporter